MTWTLLGKPTEWCISLLYVPPPWLLSAVDPLLGQTLYSRLLRKDSRFQPGPSFLIKASLSKSSLCSTLSCVFDLLIRQMNLFENNNLGFSGSTFYFNYNIKLP